MRESYTRKNLDIICEYDRNAITRKRKMEENKELNNVISEKLADLHHQIAKSPIPEGSSFFDIAAMYREGLELPDELIEQYSSIMKDTSKSFPKIEIPKIAPEITKKINKMTENFALKMSKIDYQKNIVDAEKIVSKNVLESITEIKSVLPEGEWKTFLSINNVKEDFPREVNILKIEIDASENNSECIDKLRKLLKQEGNLFDELFLIIKKDNEDDEIIEIIA